MSDWAGIQDNDGQFSTDAEGTVDPADRDYLVQATGRDLERFSFTYDADNLYLYVQRYASTSNQNDWWFYLDTDADGLMEDNEPLLNVRWSGSNRRTERILWQYEAASPTGDFLADPSTGVADGYDLPGTNENGARLDPPGANIIAGSTDGVRMETWIAWSELGLSGPTSIGFHISSSNGQNLPNQLDDNMDGPLGNVMLFVDLALTKTVDTAVALGNEVVTYALTVSNTSASTVTGIVVEDQLSAVGLSYLNDDSAATGTTYDQVTGAWTIPLLPADSELTLQVEATAAPTTPQTLTNTAAIIALGAIDTNDTNDSSQATVAFHPGPNIELSKSMTVVDDFINTIHPKSIPGALIDYIIVAANSGEAAAQTVELTDQLPPEVELFVGALDGGDGPVEFIDGDGAGNNPSGLTYTFQSLASTTDDIDFSSNGGADNFSYVPIPDADGFDANVTDVRLSPGGTLDAPAAAEPPRASFRLRVRLE